MPPSIGLSRIRLNLCSLLISIYVHVHALLIKCINLASRTYTTRVKRIHLYMISDDLVQHVDNLIRVSAVCQ